MFGTHERFELLRAAWSRRGSVFYIVEDFNNRGLLHLGSHKGAEMLSGADFLFDLKLIVGGVSVPYMYKADAGSMRIVSGENTDRWVELAITDRQHLRVRGHGAGLRLELNSTNPGGGARALRGLLPINEKSFAPSGAFEAEFGRHGKLLLKALCGSMLIDAPYDAEAKKYTKMHINFLPDAKTGEFDAAIHEYDDTLVPFGSYEPFEALVADNLADFADWKRKYPPVAKGYEETAEYAMWVVWSHRINPRGKLKEPIILFHHHWAVISAPWQQSYNAMPMQGDLKEAWRLICTMFAYQDERTGMLPGMMSYNGPAAGFQPAFQGFALEFILRNTGDDFISKSEARRMYPKFVKWINYWTTYRSAGRGDDVTAIRSPHESGWDDASTFSDGFPAEDPNTSAFLILLMECAARLAKKCGDAAEADELTARAEKLTKTLIDEYWDGEKFVTKVKGKAVNALSLACYQPIILGKRLPQHIIDKVAEKVTEPGAFLTEIGLASESMKSDQVTFGISFVCGRVVAPQNMIIAVGLQAAGKQAEAELCARRFCDQVKRSGIILGFAPYDHFPLTGEPAPDQPMPFATDGWPWTSWCANSFMTLAAFVLDK